MNQEHVQKILDNIFQFLFTNVTYELGNLQYLWRMSVDCKPIYYQWLFSCISETINYFSCEGQESKSLEFLDLIFLLIDSLIFNLYSKHKAGDKAKINNSLYQNSIISVQGSGQFLNSVQPIIAGDVSQLINAIENFLANEQLFVDLQNLLSLNSSDQVKLQFSYMIDSLEYFIQKEGPINENKFRLYQDNRQCIEDFLIDKEKLVNQQEIDEVNNIIFSKKILRIKKVITAKGEDSWREIQFTIARIYFSAYSKKRSNFKRQEFVKIPFSGEDIINTLLKLYINSIMRKDQLFKEEEGIFNFIINFLLLTYLPTYNTFQELFDQYILPVKPGNLFFKNITTAVQNYFIPYFEQLPSDLCNFLAQIYQLINESKQFIDSTPPIFPIKQLFINKFLLNIDIKQLSIPQEYDLEQFAAAANQFKDLFYHNPNNQQKEFQELSTQIRNLYEYLMTSYDYDKVIDIFSYYQTDPLLRNDYSYLHEYIKITKFNDQDKKDMEIFKYEPNLPKRAKGKQLSSRILSSIEQQSGQISDQNQKDQLNELIRPVKDSNMHDTVKALTGQSPKQQQKEPEDIVEKLTGLKSVIEQQDNDDSFRQKSLPQKQSSPNQKQKPSANFGPTVQQNSYEYQFQPPSDNQIQQKSIKEQKSMFQKQKQNIVDDEDEFDLELAWNYQKQPIQQSSQQQPMSIISEKSQSLQKSEYNVHQQKVPHQIPVQTKEQGIQTDMVSLNNDLSAYSNIQSALSKQSDKKDVKTKGVQTDMQEIVPQIDEDEITQPYKEKIQQMEIQNQLQIRKLVDSYEKQLKQKDEIITSMRLESNILNDDLRRLKLENKDQKRQLEWHDQEAKRTEMKIGQLLDERDVYVKHYNQIEPKQISPNTKGIDAFRNKRNQSEEDEFYVLSNQLQNRQKEVFEAQSKHEIHTRRFQKQY